RETAGISHFHIVFLVKLTKFLGFFPNGSFSSKTPYFDLLEGCFCRSIPEHIHYVAPPLSKMLSLLTTTSFEESARICFETTVRSGLLGKLLEYFRLHMDGLKEIRSYEVLKSVFI
ncbi:MAG: DNA repair protein RecO, partial [Bacteroidetes bacterium]|nr:DNA repair protein RecO [Bacteroidota bacterium]